MDSRGTDPSGKKGGIIGEILRRAGAVTPEQLERGLELQSRQGTGLLRALADAGSGEEGELLKVVAKGLGLEFVSGPAPPVTQEAAAMLPAEFCRKKLVAPLGMKEGVLRLAVVDPLDYFTLQDAEFRTGKRVAAVVTTRNTLDALLAKLYIDPLLGELPEKYEGREAEGVEAELESAEEDLDLVAVSRIVSGSQMPPVIRLVNQVLSQAVAVGASDIHVEPQEELLLVRTRVDGQLRDLCRIPKEMQDAVISRLKIMSGMDIADRRRPQDGRSQLKYQGKRIDLRVSTLPTQYGEKVVLRILDSSKSQIEIEESGLLPENLAMWKSMLAQPQGMVLVTGPTGSGKTSTLYASLNWVKSPTNNIITVEDPIEYRLPGINQMQINAKAGVTFAAGLRSILRQDPNIVMVGEIRDRETAGIAIEAAQTGHLLLSTLHTNNAPATITRLLDLGVEPFLVAASVLGILGQRLVRRPCPHCVEPAELAVQVIERAGGLGRLPENAHWVMGKGCEQCQQSGYKGRLAIHELLQVNEEIRDLIIAGAAEHKLREAAKKSGMRSLLEDGINKSAMGMTTLEEVLRAVSSEEEQGEKKEKPEWAPETLEIREVPGRQPGERAPRLLLVEDSPTIVTVVKYFLELEGYEVKTAKDGLEGLELAWKEPFDLIVSDLNMPGMDGMQLLTKLRGDPKTKDIALLLLTSDDNPETEARMLELGADDFVLKPVEPRRLAARIKALLARKRKGSVVPTSA